MEAARFHHREELAEQTALPVGIVHHPRAPVDADDAAVAQQDEVERDARDGAGGEADDEVAAVDPERPQGRFGAVTADWIDDDVRAAELLRPIFQILARVVDRLVGARGLTRCDTVGARRGRDDPRPERLCHVDGGAADAAGRSEH